MKGAEKIKHGDLTGKERVCTGPTFFGPASSDIILVTSIKNTKCITFYSSFIKIKIVTLKYF